MRGVARFRVHKTSSATAEVTEITTGVVIAELQLWGSSDGAREWRLSALPYLDGHEALDADDTIDDTEQCTLCFGRGYRGGGKLPTCKRCRGAGSVPKGSYNRDPWGFDPVRRVTTFRGKPVT